MRITVGLLLLAAVTHAAELKTSRNEKKSEESGRTDKRALAAAESTAGVDKRVPVLPTPSPSVAPGIEYVEESKILQREKTPAQLIYATPAPRLAKISDVLSGHQLEHGPGQFQATIASHLYSPVSVYQARLSSPTTYEVSAPVASQLAYSENISYQPQRVQYTPPVRQYNQLSPHLAYRNVQAVKQANLARLPDQYLVQQPLYQPQIVYQNPQPQFQQVYSHAPQVAYQVQPYAQQLVQQQVQPGIVYARQEASAEQARQQPAQRELKAQGEPAKGLEKQRLISEQNYQQQLERSQGAVSYASFSQSQPAANAHPQHQQRPLYRYQSQPLIQYQAQHHSQQQVEHPSQQQAQQEAQQQAQQEAQQQAQHQAQQQAQQLAQQQAQQHAQQQAQQQAQHQAQQQAKQLAQQQAHQQAQHQEQQAQPQTQYQTQTQHQPSVSPQPPQQYEPQQTQYQIQTQQESQGPYQPQYQTQSQHQADSQYQTQVQQVPQYQLQAPQYTQKFVPSPNAISGPAKPVIIPGQYFRTLVPVQPQLYSDQEVLVQGPGYAGQSLAVAPTFPPVQYFGKFAQSIFGSYQR